jgi:hypothetical protein
VEKLDESFSPNGSLLLRFLLAPPYFGARFFLPLPLIGPPFFPIAILEGDGPAKNGAKE